MLVYDNKCYHLEVTIDNDLNVRLQFSTNLITFHLLYKGFLFSQSSILLLLPTKSPGDLSILAESFHFRMEEKEFALSFQEVLQTV